MIITLLAWIYITFLCWCWGSLLLRLIARTSSGKNTFHFSIICFTGFAAITIAGAMLSLFLPLGSWIIQLILLLPVLLLVKRLQKPFFEVSIPPIPATLLMVCLIGILCMCAWTIIHPDTLGYHSQTIKWIEEYSVVPGLVNLNARYGYQGLWFVSCAIFSFSFTGSDAITYINTTILAWYIIFIIDRISYYLEKGENYYRGFLWLLLLVFTLWNYNHVRLTATSASADFIAILCVLLVFYIICEMDSGNKTLKYLFAIFFSVFAFTIKLSTIPLILIGIYGLIELLRLKMNKHAILSVMIGLLIITPFITRNIISSGWVIFPSTFPEIASVDWKLGSERTSLEKDYIKSYARVQSGDSKTEIEHAIRMDHKEWLPLWWSQRSMSDKTLIITFLVSLIFGAMIFRKLVGQNEIRVALFTSLIGAVFWFIQAPDPRFGAGFLIALPAILLAYTRIPVLFGARKIFLGLIASVIIIVSCYTVYRFVNYFSAKQILLPAGIAEKEAREITCQDLKFYIPAENEPCADITIPCVYDSCSTFELRGKKIRNGFRAK